MIGATGGVGPSFGVGRTIYVDSVFGDDSTGEHKIHLNHLKP